MQNVSTLISSTPEDLADVLQRVVTIHEEIRPHLDRYQELLRSSNRQVHHDMAATITEIRVCLLS